MRQCGAAIVQVLLCAAVSTALKFQVINSAPTTIEVEYEGKTYFVRAALGVLNVRPAGSMKTPDGIPAFEVSAGLNLSVEEKKG